MLKQLTTCWGSSTFEKSLNRKCHNRTPLDHSKWEGKKLDVDLSSCTIALPVCLSNNNSLGQVRATDILLNYALNQSILLNAHYICVFMQCAPWNGKGKRQMGRSLTTAGLIQISVNKWRFAGCGRGQHLSTQTSNLPQTFFSHRISLLTHWGVVCRRLISRQPEGPLETSPSSSRSCNTSGEQHSDHEEGASTQNQYQHQFVWIKSALSAST